MGREHQAGERTTVFLRLGEKEASLARSVCTLKVALLQTGFAEDGEELWRGEDMGRCAFRGLQP